MRLVVAVLFFWVVGVSPAFAGPRYPDLSFSRLNLTERLCANFLLRFRIDAVLYTRSAFLEGAQRVPYSAYDPADAKRRAKQIQKYPWKGSLPQLRLWRGEGPLKPSGIPDTPEAAQKWLKTAISQVKMAYVIQVTYGGPEEVRSLLQILSRLRVRFRDGTTTESEDYPSEFWMAAARKLTAVHIELGQRAIATLLRRYRHHPEIESLLLSIPELRSYLD